MNADPVAKLVAAVVLALGVGVVAWTTAPRKHTNSGAGFAQEDPPAQPRTLSPSLKTGRRPAPIYQRVPVEAGTPSESRQGNDAEPSTEGASTGFLPRDLAPGFFPTAEGLYAASIELWEQPEFARGRDLPTLEDCERGLRDAFALEALELFQATTAQLGDVYAWPIERRGQAFAKVVKSLEASRVAAGWVLFMRLDEVTTFHAWTDTWQAFEEWNTLGEVSGAQQGEPR